MNAKMNMLKPFIFASLDCAAAIHIFTQVILPNVLYSSSIWNLKDKVSFHSHLQTILAAYYNPSTDSLHLISGVPPTRLLMSRERLQILRSLICTKLTHIINTTKKSTVAKQFIVDSKKLIPRTATLVQCVPSDFSKAKIQILLSLEWRRQWKSNKQNGQCQQGRLTEMAPEHLFTHALPLKNPRTLIGELCSLLNGHSKLQLFQYLIKNTYTPTCSGLMKDETPSHFLYRCKEFTNLRNVIEPNPESWESIPSFIKSTG